MATLERWRLGSIQRHVGGDSGADEDGQVDLDTDSEQHGDWIKLYEDGNFTEAERSATLELQKASDRRRIARVCNDRGYIRYGLSMKDEARRDLQRALDLHHHNLPLTLSNLGVSNLDDGNYQDAIEHIRDAMFLTLSEEDVAAGYLRLRLPVSERTKNSHWEQHPANVLEASYINLSFALYQSDAPQEAGEILQEGLSLMPSSMRLRHALARLQMSRKRVDLAEPIYRSLAQETISDPLLANEVSMILRLAPRPRSRGRKRR